MFVALLEGARFPWNSGLVRNASNFPSHESFPRVRANFPARELTLATLAGCWVRRCVSHGRNSEWNGRTAVWARTGHGDCNHMETLASPVLQPTLVIQVTESRDQHHRSPSGALRIYPCIARGDVWYKMSAKCWNSSSSS